MAYNTVSLIIFICSTIGLCSCYLPVIMMHGLDGYPSEFSRAIAYLKTEHPGQLAISLNVNNGGQSHQPMTTQVAQVTAAANAIIANYSAEFANGYHVVGHSQGGLMMRAVIMQGGLKGKVENFVSLAGPQFGVYGNYSEQGMQGLTPAEITAMLYTPSSQSTRSFANYWRDPTNFQAYIDNAKFLAVLNNETYNPQSWQWKKNFLALNHVVLCASPADVSILPWESSVFGFWDKGVKSIVPMQSQAIYTQDSFGLQTLDQQNKLITHVVPGVGHSDWMNKQAIWETYVVPYLY